MRNRHKRYALRERFDTFYYFALKVCILFALFTIAPNKRQAETLRKHFDCLSPRLVGGFSPVINVSLPQTTSTNMYRDVPRVCIS